MRSIGCQLVSITLLASLLGNPVTHAAEAPIPPRISALERLRLAAAKPADDDDEGQPAAKAPRDPALEGRLLIGELNCVACHAADEQFLNAISIKQAPVLDDLAYRVKYEWLHDAILDMHAAKPGTTMPDVFVGQSPEVKSLSTQPLAHFLTLPGTAVDVVRDNSAGERGKDLFHKVGCIACHDSPEEAAAKLPTSVPLPNLSQKYSSTSLTAFLKETHKFRPSGRMPTFPLNDQQFRDLSHYLVKDVDIEPNVNFAVYHGSWGMIPKFDELKPVHQSQSGGFDLAVGGRTNDFGIRFRAHLLIKQAGKFTFHVGSDDGSRLIIDGKTVVDHDGIHPYGVKTGAIELTADWHDVQLDYIQGGGEWELTAEIEGPGLQKQPLGTCVTRERKMPEAKPQVVLLPFLYDSGRKQFAELGCANCHVRHHEGQRIVGLRTGKPLKDIDPAKGCLAETPPKGAVNYHLSPEQRADIVAALQTPPVETPAQTVHRQLLTFNCYACHQRDGWGGVEESRNAYFESLIKEMGDESRLPPTLTGVGDKLRPEWLNHVLENSSDDRKNYMLAKMPKFGKANVGALAKQFAAIDTPPLVATPPEFAEPEYRIKAAGRHLVGGNALSCIKCHDFREHPSTGIRAISLTTMSRRLNEDWFYRYMLNPQVYRPGTRMPAPWPNGKASLTDVLKGDANLQMRAVWLYLADGDKAAVPAGLVREPIELKPTDAPIIYRNFIQRAGNRAIAVGYPEGLNLAFDANEFRLALIWHGAFLDASQHWTGRGPGAIDPLGDNVLDFLPQPSFAKLASAGDTWPQTPGREAGFQFQGYRLDKQKRPTFRYRFGEIAIEDFPEPFANGGDKYPALKRTLTLTGAPPADGVVWFRAAVANEIKEIEPGTYRIDDTWTIRLKSAEKPTIRDAGGMELLVPVKFTDGKAVIVQEYVW